MELYNFPQKYHKAVILKVAMQITLKQIGEVMAEYNLTKSGDDPTNFISEEDPEMVHVVTQRGINEANWLTAKYSGLEAEYMNFFGAPNQPKQSKGQE